MLYRFKKWLDFFWNYRILKGKNRIDPRKFRIDTIPTGCFVASNVIVCEKEGATVLVVDQYKPAQINETLWN